LTEPTVLIPTQPIPSAPSFLLPSTRYLNVKAKISTYNNSAPYFKAKIFGGTIMAPQIKAKTSGEETSISLLIQDSIFPTYTHTQSHSTSLKLKIRKQNLRGSLLARSDPKWVQAIWVHRGFKQCLLFVHECSRYVSLC
jgi:hypothetical protein